MMPVACPDPERLARWSAGRLPEVRIAEIAEHLDRCAACLSALDGLGEVDSGLAGLGDAAPADPILEEPGCRRALERFAAIAVRSPGAEAVRTGSDPDLPAGTRLGAYEILGPLGRGGMGAVYRARHTLLKREVALKVLPADRPRRPRDVARFRREMEAAGKLGHPNVVVASDAGEDGGILFLVMELVDGPDLGRLVKARGPLGVADACELIRQAAEGLEHAHRRGLVHRDIKPSNLILAPDGRVKLLDLGVARLRDEAEAGDGEALTRTGEVLGTADFMAPEQASGIAEVDIRADVYSLGCTLYYLLAGHAPFHGPRFPTLFTKLAAHAGAPVPAITSERPGVPERVAALLGRMLEKDPADRPATPAEVAAALAPFAVGSRLADLLGPAAGPIGMPATEVAPAVATLAAPAPGGRASTGRWLAFGVAAPLLAVGALLAGPVLLRIRDKEGKETVYRVPEGGRAELEHDGRVIPLVTAEGVPPRLGPDPGPAAPALPAPPAGAPLSPTALVGRPAVIPGVQSWTIVPARHRGGIRALVSSPDGRLLATSGSDGTIRLWDAGSGRASRVLVTPTTTHQLAWSPDGATLAAGAEDGIQLWSPGSGRLVRTLKAVDVKGIAALAWSPDGATLAAIGGGGGADGGILKLWDAESGRVLQTLKGFGGALAWSPDGKALAVSARDGSVQVRRPESGELLRETKATSGESSAWSPDGRTLAFLAPDGNTLRLWRPDADAPPHVVAASPGGMQALAWSPDGRRLATAHADGAVRTWRADSGQPEFTVAGFKTWAKAVSWSPDGSRIVAAGNDGSIRAWRADDGRPTWDLGGLAGWEVPPWSVAWSPDGRRLAIGRRDGTIQAWDASSGRLLLSFGTGTECHGLAWSPDGTRLATSGNRVASLWEADSGQPLQTLKEDVDINLLAWSSDGQTLASASEHEKGSVRLSRTATGEVIRDLPGPPRLVQGLAFSPDGKLLAILLAFPDPAMVVEFWRTDSGTLERTLPRWPGLGNVRLAWSPDGMSLVVRSLTGTDSTWDIAAGGPLRVRGRPAPGVSSPDGRRTASSTSDGRISLFDAATGAPRGTLTSLGDTVLAIGPEGHCRGTDRAERAGDDPRLATARAMRELAYVVLIDGHQETLTPEEFAARYGWRNDPGRVRLAE